MSQPQRGSSDLLSENLDYAVRTAASELTRGETKASILLAINSVGLGFVATSLDRAQPVPVLVTGALGAAFLLFATFTLLIAVRPNPIDRDGTSLGWSRWALMDRDEVRTHLATDRRPDTIVFLSRGVSMKFQMLRRAVNFILIGISLVAAAGVLSLIIN
ncbi:Pycsar system effector family protein [Streptomyces longwoodensis]|uniref:Pycsar system effector family protein n=1 Tax=Streptomyces longwoodensis TaxID=68231 RepID=UPI0033C5B5AF